MSQVTRWCFTIFSNEKTSETELNEIKYLVAQDEICPKTGKLHMQGYVIFKRSQRLKAAQKILGYKSIHLEMANGTDEQCIKYCTKEETRVKDTQPTEYGEKPKLEKGKRTDWVSLKEYLQESKTTTKKELTDKFPTLMGRYEKGVKSFCKTYKVKLINEDEKRNEMTQIYIITGKTNIGKTTYVKELKDTYWKDENHLWWDNYEGEKTIIINDYTGLGKVNNMELLKLSDHAPYELQQKGGSTQLLAKEIWITTNLTKQEFYKGIMIAEHKKALERRIKWKTLENYKLIDWEG